MKPRRGKFIIERRSGIFKMLLTVNIFIKNNSAILRILFSNFFQYLTLDHLVNISFRNKTVILFTLDTWEEVSSSDYHQNDWVRFPRRVLISE